MAQVVAHLSVDDLQARIPAAVDNRPTAGSRERWDLRKRHAAAALARTEIRNPGSHPHIFSKAFDAPWPSQGAIA